MALALAGFALGLPVSLAVSKLLSVRLFHVTPHDLQTFLTVSLVLLAVSLAASWFPARRATAIDPIATLRAD